MNIIPARPTGAMLDSFARRSLWEAGLDYLHGTGHGVGAFLNVHEGPQQISFRMTAHDAAMEAGVFMSDGKENNTQCPVVMATME